MSECNRDPVPAAVGQDFAWPAGPGAPRLARGAAHVWRADLGTVSDDMLGALTDDERKRAERVGGWRERMLWTRSRSVLRELLGRYLHCVPDAVELAVGIYGKLELVNAREQRPELFFNLSHSRHLALYAFSAEGPVGVDVQVAREARLRPGVDHIALARRALGEHEAQRLSLVDPTHREREFLRAWSCHEAELKRLGTGIGVRADDETGTDHTGADQASTPWIVELSVGGNAAGALALERRPDELRRWGWARGS